MASLENLVIEYWMKMVSRVYESAKRLPEEVRKIITAIENNEGGNTPNEEKN
jgi:hypothetical protein